MANKASKTNRRIALWPGDFTAVHALIALSLMLNVALVAVLIALAQTNIFDDQIASRGAEILCSDEYLGQVKPADSKALLNYSCATEQSQSYFIDGYNKYRESIGLSPIKE